MKSEEATEIKRLGELLISLAENRSKLHNQETFDLPLVPPDSDIERLTKLAERELKRRNVRGKYLPSDMFAEGGWNILLDLFVAGQSDKPISITSSCIASCVPTSTALRHIALLIERGLIVRTPDTEDKRREFLSITRLGQDAICRILEEMSQIGGRNKAKRSLR